MATIAEIELPAAEFALGETLGRLPGVRFDVESVVTHGGDRTMPLVRAIAADSDADGDEIEASLSADSSVEDASRLATLDEGWLFEVRWNDRVTELVDGFTENGTIVTAIGERDAWKLRVLVPDREVLSRTHDYCTRRGLSADVKRIYRLGAEGRGRLGVVDR